MRNQIQTFLNLSSVNFEKVDEVNRFAGNLINLGNSLGAINDSKRLQSQEAVAIYQAAKGWVNTVKNRLPLMTLSDAVRVIGTYEIMYRIANWTSAKPIEIDNVKLAAFDAMIHGDKNVDEYIMFRLIRKAIRQREKVFLGKPLKWSCLKEDQWHKEAKTGFDRTKLSDYDILNRTSILLESDLYAFEGRRQQDFKHQLFNSTRHYLDNYDTTDSKTQFAAEQYLYASAKFLTEEEFDKYHSQVLKLKIEPVA